MTYRDNTQVLIYCREREGWKRLKQGHVKCTRQTRVSHRSSLRSPTLYLLLNVTQRPYSFRLYELTTEINWLTQWHTCENLENID
jgi:hypothetical protein